MKLKSSLAFLTLVAAMPAQGAILAYYNFDGQTNNQAGPSPNATLNGPAVLTAANQGRTGGAGDESLDLGGVNNAASASVAGGTHLDSSFNNDTMAVSWWQYNTGVGNSSSFWVHSPTATNNVRGFQGHVAWGNGSIFFDSAGCCASPATRLTDNVAAPSQIIENQWQHFVMQKDAAGNKQVWVDGTLYLDQVGGANSLLPFDGQIQIGAEPPTANSFGGRIDDFAILDQVLTPTEIGRLAGGEAFLDVIPEPSGTLLSLLGLVALGLRRRR